MNQRVEFALGDPIEERAHFVFLSINLKFHAAVREVAYPSSDIEAFCDMPHGPAETDALDVALVKYLKRDHGSLILAKESARESPLILERWELDVAAGRRRVGRLESGGERSTSNAKTNTMTRGQEGASLIGVNQTEAALPPFNQIDRDKILTAVRRRKAGGRLFPGIMSFSLDFLAGLIINTDRDFC